MIQTDDRPLAGLSPDSPRRNDWLFVFGRLDCIPLTGYQPQAATVPGRPDALVYMLDLERLAPAERERLIHHLAVRFKLHVAEVARDLDRVGCPILAEDVLVAVPMRLLN